MRKIPILVLSLLLVGCVSQSKYDLLNQEFEDLKSSYETKVAQLESKVSLLEANKIQLENDRTSLIEQRNYFQQLAQGRLEMMFIPTTMSQGRHVVNHPMFSFTYEANGLDEEIYALMRPFGVQLWHITDNSRGDLITFYVIPESQMELYDLPSRNILQRFANNIVLVRSVPISYDFPMTDEIGTKLHEVVKSIVVRYVR
jgi:outer membrane murein-binding lipoprotein Lpp